MTTLPTCTVRQHIVLHLKMIELLHLMTLSIHLTDTGTTPANLMGHKADRYVETLLGAIVTAFMALCDGAKSTNARKIWKQLYPGRSASIDQIWESKIQPGEVVMRRFRHKAGAHGDRIEGYLDAKIELLKQKEVVLDAIHAFVGLSASLDKDQNTLVPSLTSDIEEVLRELEAARPDFTFSRQWLREMLLVESGPSEE